MAKAFDTSARLLRRYKDGDEKALHELVERLLHPVRRWAHGRLPRWARDTMNTDDIVQDVLARSVHHLGSFEPRHAGALQSYLRQAVLHRIRDEMRRSRREPDRAEVRSDARVDAPTPEDEAASSELFEAYEAALQRLDRSDREAISLRIHDELPYREIARLMGKPSEEAAQMAVGRALDRLAREMGKTR